MATVLWPWDHSAVYPDSGTSQVQILQADPGEQTPRGGQTHPLWQEKSPNLWNFSSRPRGILDYLFLLVLPPREASGRMDAWAVFLLLPASPSVCMLSPCLFP